MCCEGTKNFYYFDVDIDSFNNLNQMLTHTKNIMDNLSNRSGN